jgi:hypothetical protein
VTRKKKWVVGGIVWTVFVLAVAVVSFGVFNTKAGTIGILASSLIHLVAIVASTVEETKDRTVVGFFFWTFPLSFIPGFTLGFLFLVLLSIVETSIIEEMWKRGGQVTVTKEDACD